MNSSSILTETLAPVTLLVSTLASMKRSASGCLIERVSIRASPATVLGHFARRVRVTLHEGDDTGRGERRVEHRTTCGADVRKVVPHAAAPLHQLHLLLVHAEDAAVGVCRILVADDEAVRKRSRLEVVADTGHGTALRDDVAEVVEQFEHLLPVHRIGVLLFDPFDLGGDALVHIARSFFVNMAVRIFQGIFAYPNRSGQVVSVEIFFSTLRPLRCRTLRSGRPGCLLLDMIS